jgi:hypothetical protein
MFISLKNLSAKIKILEKAPAYTKMLLMAKLKNDCYVLPKKISMEILFMMYMNALFLIGE